MNEEQVEMQQDGAGVGAEDIMEDIYLDDLPGFEGDEGAGAEQPEDAQQVVAAAGEPPKGQEPDGVGEKKADSIPAVFTLRHDHRDVQVNAEEMTQLAQKGLNYDRVAGQLEELQSGPAARAVEVLQRYAQKDGMTLEGYLGFLERQAEDGAVQQLVQEGMTPQAARQYQLMQKEMERRAQAEQAEAARAMATQRFLPLVLKYPGLSVEAMPAEVRSAIEQGADPLAAYEGHLKDAENQRLRAQLLAEKKNTRNRQIAPGSAAGSEPPDGDDPFLQGFA